MTLRYLLLTLLTFAVIGGAAHADKPVLRIEPGMHTAMIKAISAAGRFQGTRQLAPARDHIR